MKLTTELREELKLIEIPTIDNYDQFEKAREKAWSKDLESCPCCGRGIENPQYYINTAFGGSAYLSSDRNEYDDCWVMVVGVECRKKFPEGYVFQYEN